MHLTILDIIVLFMTICVANYWGKDLVDIIRWHIPGIIEGTIRLFKRKN
jgi:putative effector of murein hydrolase LrgA (UPF0299 family)